MAGTVEVYINGEHYLVSGSDHTDAMISNLESRGILILAVTERND